VCNKSKLIIILTVIIFSTIKCVWEKDILHSSISQKYKILKLFAQLLNDSKFEIAKSNASSETNP